MAKDTSPLSVRLTQEERRLIEMVAVYSGRSVSEFVRSVAVDSAASIVRDHGADKIVQTIEERNDELSQQRRSAFEAAAELHSASRSS